MTWKEFFFYALLVLFRPRSSKTMEWRMLRLLNKDRKYHRLQPVRMQEDLREVARKHSADMASKNYFDHVNLKAQSPADRLRLGGVSEVISGENLAMIGGYPNATQQAEVGLMNSPGHRANILNSLYNAVGIGVIQSKSGVYYFTQNFAKRGLIFKNRFKKNVPLQKGLHLTGEIFSNMHLLYYQVFLKGQLSPLQERIIDLQGRRFDVSISFPHQGTYEVKLYGGEKKNAPLHLVNSLEFTVRKSFWHSFF